MITIERIPCRVCKGKGYIRTRAGKVLCPSCVGYDHTELVVVEDGNILGRLKLED